jgi:hypothetical protein
MKSSATWRPAVWVVLLLLTAAGPARAQNDPLPVPVAVTNAVTIDSILKPVGIVAPMFTPAQLASVHGVVESGKRMELLFDETVLLQELSVAGLSAPESGCLLRVYVNDLLAKVGIIIPPWERPRPWPRFALPAVAVGDWQLPAVDLTPNDRLGFELQALGSGPASRGKCSAAVVALATLPAVQ